ncbi:MAG TPA: hypothetical protein VGG39_36140 [Polyangiaceae bacterium]|jgi:hypothetical protein
MRGAKLVAASLLCAGAWASTSCAPSGFAVVSLVQSVRILASSSDPAYAQPGQQVGVQVLAYDGRTTQPEPMKIYWLPFVCEDPPDDAYYACFTQLAGDGGAPDGGAASGGGDDGGPGLDLGALRPGVDLSPFLPVGTSYQFQMPADVVTNHIDVPGSNPAHYGIAILFNVACAGHLELVPSPSSGDNPQQIPFGCFDANENQLGPDDWVLGFTRVYAFEPDAGPDGGPLLNQNPVIASVDVQGQTLDVALVPGTTQSYVTQAIQTPPCSGDCPSIPIGPNVPASSDEPNAQATTVNGGTQNEEIWADFYTTFGSFAGDTSLLYDATKGSIGDAGTTDNQWKPPGDAGTGTIWIVVHDDRGGASWVTVPVNVQ